MLLCDDVLRPLIKICSHASDTCRQRHRADIGRLNRDLAVSRARKRNGIISDKRIKTCMSSCDNGLKFLGDVCHSVGEHSSVLCEEGSDKETGDDIDEDDQDHAEQSSRTKISVKSVLYRLVTHVVHLFHVDMNAFVSHVTNPSSKRKHGVIYL